MLYGRRDETRRDRPIVEAPGPAGRHHVVSWPFGDTSRLVMYSPPGSTAPATTAAAIVSPARAVPPAKG